MSIPKFANILTLSNQEITEKVIQTENELFKLRFKKATRQPFKPNEIKNSKRLIAHLKTLLTVRLNDKVDDLKIS